MSATCYMRRINKLNKGFTDVAKQCAELSAKINTRRRHFVAELPRLFNPVSKRQKKTF